MADKPVLSNTAPKGSSGLAALFRILGTVIIIFVILLGIPAALPRLFGYQVYNIVSGSMEPTIPIGAAVYAKPVEPFYIVEGDIIAYNSQGDVIVHRVIENDNASQTIRTKGDANDAEDMWAIPYDDVYGRVKVSVKYLGDFLVLVTTGSGKTYILAILFAGVMFTVLGKLLAPKEAKASGGKSGAAKGKPSLAKGPAGKKGKGTAKAAAAAASGGATLTVDAAVLDAKAKAEGKAPSVPAEEAPNEPDKVITTKDLPDKAEAPKAPVKPDKKAAKAEAKKAQAEAKRAKAEAAKAAKAAKSGKGKPVKEEKTKDVEKADKAGKAGKADKTTESAKAEKAKAPVKPEKDSNDEYEKYKKAIKIIIIIVIALILACVGYYVYRVIKYKRMDEMNNSAQQFAQAAQATPEPVAEPEEEPEEAPPEIWHLDVTEPCPLDIDFNSLWEINEDIIAWLYCEDTVINYPVLQGEDNDYYLHHTYEHKETAAGSIFIDSQNMSDFSDVNTIIYGHHMKNGSMFAGLQHWENQEYYDAHKYMWLITPDANYQVWLFSGYLTDAYNEEVYQGIRIWDEASEHYIKTAYDGSDFKADVPLEDLFRGDPETDQHYIMLSTCEYEFQNARYVLHGKLVKEY